MEDMEYDNKKIEMIEGKIEEMNMLGERNRDIETEERR